LEPYLYLRVLDPAVGCGTYLVAAAEFLSRKMASNPDLRYRPKHHRQTRYWRLAVSCCLSGVDVDPVALWVARILLEQLAPGTPPTYMAGSMLLHHGNFLHSYLPESGLEADRAKGEIEWRRIYSWMFARRGGFDAVLGNPPFNHVRTGLIPREETGYLRSRWSLAQGQWDLFAPMTECAFKLLRPGGRWSFVLPRRALTNENFAAFRQLVFAQNNPEVVLDVGQAFPEAGVECVVVTATKSIPGPDARLRIEVLEPTGIVSRGEVPLATLRHMPFGIIPLRHSPEAVALAARLAEMGQPLGTLADITRGIEAGMNDRHIGRKAGPGSFPLVRGEDVGPFRVAHSGWHVTPDPERVGKYKASSVYAAPKLLIRFVARGLIAAHDDVGYHTTNVLYNVHARCDLLALCALLNSRLLDWWFRLTFQGDEDLFPHVQKSQLRRVPILFGSGRDRRRLARLARTVTELTRQDGCAERIAAVRDGIDETVVRTYGVEPAAARAMFGGGA
jgi:adenine-specific DNA-methyltransferase